MSDINTALDEIRKVFLEHRLAVLATVNNDNAPYSSLVGFSSSDDLSNVFFATSKKTVKYSNLTSNPAVSMLVDNRANTSSDFSDAVAITLTGFAEEIAGEERDSALKDFCRKLPELEKFTAEESCALIRVRVDRYVFVGNFQEVREIVMNQK